MYQFQTSQSRKSYFFLNHQGECLNLPNFKEVECSDLSNKPYILIPDNNVCIHVSDLNVSKQQKIKTIKAENFLEYTHKSKITVNPLWGLLERSSKPGTLNLDHNKLKDFEDAFWRKLHLYTNNDMFSSKMKSVDSLKYWLYPLYTYLLKIKLILAKREASSKNAEKNIQELYDFVKEFKIYLAIPWQFAIAIFGGNNKMNKLINSRKKDNIFKALWGAAWDLYYIQLIHEHNGTREINNSFPQYILATDDKPCANVASIIKVIAAIDYGYVIYNQTLINYDFPHWKNKDEFLFKINQQMYEDVEQRAIKRISMSEADLQNETETIIDTSSQYIAEFTKELEIIQCKGFGR